MRKTESAADEEKRGVVSFWGTMIALAIAVVSLFMDILRDAIGLTYPGLLGIAMDCSFVWLPLLMLVVGYALGKRTDAKAGVDTAHIRELEEPAAKNDATEQIDTLENEICELRETARKIAEEKDRALRRMVEAETERDKLSERVEFYESEPERARAMFEGLTLNQISIAELAHDSKRDFATQKSGHKYHAAVARPDVFVVFDRDDGSAVISLTDEWERMMNRYDEMFGEICRKRWSESR